MCGGDVQGACGGMCVAVHTKQPHTIATSKEPCCNTRRTSTAMSPGPTICLSIISRHRRAMASASSLIDWYCFVCMCIVLRLVRMWYVYTSACINTYTYVSTRTNTGAGMHTIHHIHHIHPPYNSHLYPRTSTTVPAPCTRLAESLP